MSLITYIKEDWQNNRNFKRKVIVVSYTIVRFFRVRMTNKFNYFLFAPIVIIYKFTTDFVLRCEIPASVEIGRGLIIEHGQGLVIHPHVIIGKGVTLKHNTTFGNKEDLNGKGLGTPIIGDNVKIGPHSIIFGPINIGSNSIIGAGSVVMKNVEPNTIVVGNPAKYIKNINN